MLEKELIALFSLCRKVMKETRAYVEFDCSNSKPSATIVRIHREGYKLGRRAEACFIMYDDESVRKILLQAYEAATAYLTRVLEENGSC